MMENREFGVDKEVPKREQIGERVRIFHLPRSRREYQGGGSDYVVISFCSLA